VLRDLEVKTHVFLFEDLVLDLLLIDLLENLLDVVLGLLEDPLFLRELHLQGLYLHVDLTQLRVTLTYLADDILCCDLVVSGKRLDLFFFGFETKYLTLILLHLHSELLDYLELLRGVFFGNCSRLTNASHGG